MFDELDRVLRTRETPEAPEGLSARIIAAAARHEQNVGAARPLWSVLKDRVFAELSELFILPRPAYAFAVVVFVLGFGLMIGSASENFDLISALTPGELASFMTIDDSFTAGEWV